MGMDELVELSRYYGGSADYVIAGGGNSSFKDDAVLYIKGSGSSLAEAEPGRFVRMDRRALGRIWEKSYPPDSAEREQAVLADMMAARMRGEEHKRPSVETLLHDLLPFAYVVHTHPARVNGLTCSREGEAAAAALFAGEALWIPSTNPGYILSRAVKEALEEHIRRHQRPAQIIFLQNHGVFVGADTAEDIREQYRRIMETLGRRIQREPDFSGELSAWGCSGELARLIRELAAPRADEAAADTRESVDTGGAIPGAAVFLRNQEIAARVKDRRSFEPVSSAFTPDHIVYAGSEPLFVEAPAGDATDTARRLRAAWDEQAARTGRQAKIAAIQGLGVFGTGPSEKAANLALALFRDTLKVAAYAESFGGPQFMSREQIDFINHWEVERYRSQVAGVNG